MAKSLQYVGTMMALMLGLFSAVSAKVSYVGVLGNSGIAGEKLPVVRNAQLTATGITSGLWRDTNGNLVTRGEMGYLYAYSWSNGEVVAKYPIGDNRLLWGWIASDSKALYFITALTTDQGSHWKDWRLQKLDLNNRQGEVVDITPDGLKFTERDKLAPKVDGEGNVYLFLALSQKVVKVNPSTRQMSDVCTNLAIAKDSATAIDLGADGKSIYLFYRDTQDNYLHKFTAQGSEVTDDRWPVAWKGNDGNLHTGTDIFVSGANDQLFLLRGYTNIPAYIGNKFVRLESPTDGAEWGIPGQPVVIADANAGDLWCFPRYFGAGINEYRRDVKNHLVPQRRLGGTEAVGLALRGDRLCIVQQSPRTGSPNYLELPAQGTADQAAAYSATLDYPFRSIPGVAATDGMSYVVAGSDRASVFAKVWAIAPNGARVAGTPKDANGTGIAFGGVGDIAVSRNVKEQGYLYLADTMGNRVGRIPAFTANGDQLFETFVLVDEAGKPLTLNKPRGIAVDEQGNLYVTSDEGVCKLQRGANSLAYTRVWQTLTTGMFVGVAVVASRAFVTDMTQAQLLIIDTATGKTLETYGHTIGKGTDQFNQPAGIAARVNAQGGTDLYVADFGNCRILHLLAQ